MSQRSRMASVALMAGLLASMPVMMSPTYRGRPKDRARMTTVQKQADNRKQRAKRKGRK